MLAAAFCAAPAYSQEKPNFSGTWKLNVQKSNFGSDPAPESVTATVEQKDDHLKDIADGVVNGQPFHEEMDVPIDGKEHPAPVEFPATVMMKWDGPALVMVLKSDDGSFVMTARLRLSADGKTVTREVERKSPEGESKHEEIYEKQ
jgi:hypothetical protein